MLSEYNAAIDLLGHIEQQNGCSVQLNKITLHYLDFGSATGTPLVWAHGSGSTGYEILNVQDGLVKLGYRVIAIDYRGHGKTKLHCDKFNTSLYHIADDINALLDYLKIETAVVGGLSKGAFVAAAFYHIYPHRVAGLLLEDGGSWSNYRLTEETMLNIVSPGPCPYPTDISNKLFDKNTLYSSRKACFDDIWQLFASDIRSCDALEFFVWALSCVHQQKKHWRFHCDVSGLMVDEQEVPAVNNEPLSSVYYSRLPIMQQSQALMCPFVIFRALKVPMLIIDPDPPNDWLPVRHQNEELRALYPDLIVHDIYDYEYSPHQAHLERPDRFLESAATLLNRVICHK